MFTDFYKYTVAALRQELAHRNLSTFGTKAVLVARLEMAVSVTLIFLNTLHTNFYSIQYFIEKQHVYQFFKLHMLLVRPLTLRNI